MKGKIRFFFFFWSFWEDKGIKEGKSNPKRMAIEKEEIQSKAVKESEIKWTKEKGTRRMKI